MNALPLSPVDYLFTGVGADPISFAFSYDHLLDPKVLQRGLEQALGSFPFLASQLVDKNDREYEYRSMKEGLSVGIATSDASFQESDSISRYITPVRSVAGNPLTRITMTQTPTGSVLAVSISHALVDGFSCFHFLSSWARLCRGERILDPSLGREGVWPVFDGDGDAITASTLYDACGLFYGERRQSLETDPFDEERIDLPEDTLASHLERAKRQYPGVSFSQNDIVVALLWKHYLPGWCRGARQPQTFMTCPVDFRRIVRSIPRNYFGCAVCMATASCDLDHLAAAPLGELALLVNQSVRRVDGEYVRGSLQTLDRLRTRSGIAELEKLHLRHPECGMIVTNLTRMPVRDLDFGSGRPVDLAIHPLVRGSAAILPAEHGVQVIVIHPSGSNAQ
jgi:hypothetical protein